MLSIIVPVYNEIAFLSKTLESIGSQKQDNIKILLGDNASSDGSQQLLSEFAEAHHNCTLVLRRSNIGAAANVCDLVQKCSTPFIAIIGAHDIIHPDWAETLLNLMLDDESLSMAYSTIAWIDKDDVIFKVTNGGDFVRNEVSSIDRINACLRHTWGECTAVNGIFRASAIKTFWFPKTTGPDHVLLARASYLGKITRVEKPLYYRREYRRDSNYHERIRGQTIFAPSKDVTALAGAHLADFVLIAGQDAFDTSELNSFCRALHSGYRPLGLTKKPSAITRVFLWALIFLITIHLAKFRQWCYSLA